MVTAKTRNRLIGASIALVAVAGVSLLIGVYMARRPATVPDLNQLTIDQATYQLEQVKLKLGTISKAATATVGPGRVVAQSPAASSQAPRRSSVEVTVAVAPESLPLPDFAGLNAGNAIATLESQLYLPVRVDVFDAGIAAETVIAQLPPAGTAWLTGNPVALAVSAGPDDGTAVKVPVVVGRTSTEAMAMLEQAGLRGAGFMVNVSDPKSNLVTTQLPAGGTLVSPGTTVLILLATP